MKTFTLRLENDLAEAIVALAEVDDRPSSEEIRLALREHVERRRMNPELRRKAETKIKRQQRLLETLAPIDPQAPIGLLNDLTKKKSTKKESRLMNNFMMQELHKVIHPQLPRVIAVAGSHGVGATTLAGSLAALAGEACQGYGTTAAIIDANFNAPYTWGQTSLETDRWSVKSVIESLVTKQPISGCLYAYSPALAIYPGEYSPTEPSPAEITLFIEHLRKRHAFSVLDVGNVYPSSDQTGSRSTRDWLSQVDKVIIVLSPTPHMSHELETYRQALPKQDIFPVIFVDPSSPIPAMAREIALVKAIPINVEGLPKIDTEDLKFRQACVSLIGKLFLSANN